MENSDNSKPTWSVMAALGAGVLASACCTVPLLLVAMGAGGAWVATFAAFEPFRPMFIVGAFGLIALAAYKEYHATMAPDCKCTITIRDRVRRGLIVAGLLVTIGLVASPTIVRSLAPQEMVAEAGIRKAGSAQVILVVDGMTCDACNLTVRHALANLEGVEDAKVTFEPPEAVVVYDPSLVSPDDMRRATTRIGYPSRLKDQ